MFRTRPASSPIAGINLQRRIARLRRLVVGPNLRKRFQQTREVVLTRLGFSTAGQQRPLTDPERRLRKIQGRRALGRLHCQGAVPDFHRPGQQRKKKLFHRRFAVKDPCCFFAQLAARLLGVLHRRGDVPLQCGHAPWIELHPAQPVLHRVLVRAGLMRRLGVLEEPLRLLGLRIHSPACHRRRARRRLGRATRCRRCRVVLFLAEQAHAERPTGS
jgi:hypothetical protein